MGLFAGVWLRKWGGGVCVLALGVCSWGFVELFAGVWLRKWGGGVVFWHWACVVGVLWSYLRMSGSGNEGAGFTFGY